MSLATGCHIKHQHLAPLPLPQEVINRVHRLFRHNPSRIHLIDRTRHPFREIIYINDDNSTYNPYFRDSDNYDDNYDDPFPGNYFDPGSEGVIYSNIHNLLLKITVV